MSPPLSELLDDLLRPEAWPWPAPDVSVVQTHISVVFLAGARVVKLKKPVDLGFLDFSTPMRRLAACEEELRVNTRLAPGVYLGLVTACRAGDGRWHVEERRPGDGDEPGVLMERLPADRTLAAMLQRGELDGSVLERVARVVAAFHDAAEAGPEVQAASGWEPLSAIVRGNLDECAPFEGRTLAPELRARLVDEAGRELAACRDLVEARAARGMGRDGHGDLRLDHVYVLEDPHRIVVVDGIEFNAAFRRGDPAADVAFLVMELQHEGRPDLARRFFDAWASARGDDEAAALLPLHVAHRHAVRGKVRSIEAAEPEVPATDREAAAARARAHFLAALSSLAPEGRRPALVLTCGLPASGKSTLARSLSESASFARLSSDETRRDLIARAAASAGRSPEDRYSPAWSDRTYAACLRRAAELLLRGERVIVDASFHEASRRAPFLELARSLHVPALVLECVTSDEVARARLEKRRHDPTEASEAGEDVRKAMAQRWQPPDAAEELAWHRIASGDARDDLAEGLRLLRAAGLADADSPA